MRIHSRAAGHERGNSVGRAVFLSKGQACREPRHACLFDKNTANGVSTLQLQPSGTRFHHTSAHHPLVVDSLELGFNPSLHTGIW